MKKYYSEKNPQKYHGLWVPNMIKEFFLFKKKKKHKIAKARECQIWYLVTRLSI